MQVGTRRILIMLVFALPAFLMLVPFSMAREQVKAPSQLETVQPEMLTAGFWINRLSNPTKQILSAVQILAFNKHIQTELKLTRDIFLLTEDLQTETLLQDFKDMLSGLTEKDYYTQDGIRNSKPLLQKAQVNMNSAAFVLGVKPRYGLVTRYTDVRFLPTKDGLYETPGDTDFDQIQNSTLEIGTPVAIVHQSADKLWFYVYAPTTQGWVWADHVAVGEEDEIRKYDLNPHFVVITAPKTDVFMETQRVQFLGSVGLGVKLPLMDAADVSRVRVPVKEKDRLVFVEGHIDPDHVHKGFVPYTPQNALNLAFNMLHQPYGWGGMYGANDCSSFVQRVFAAMGIILPRDSKDQAVAGKDLVVFNEKMDKAQRLNVFKEQNVLPGITLLTMKGHIMFYVGMFQDNPYAIHAVWAYRDKEKERDVPKVIGKVAVTGLHLGEMSQKGSWLKRLTKIITVE